MVSSLNSEKLTSLISKDSTSRLVKTTLQAVINSEKNSDKTTKSLRDVLEIDYDDDGAPKTISDMLKNYTASISDYINNLAAKKQSSTKLDGKSLINSMKKLSNNSNTLSKSAYESVGMSDYYNLKSVMTLSNAISQYSKTNSGLTSLMSNSNFTIKV